MDQLEVKVELAGRQRCSSSYGELETAHTQDSRPAQRACLQIDAKVTLVSPNTLKRFEGKAKRVDGPALI